MISAIDARHDHVYFQVVSSDGDALVRPSCRADRRGARGSRFDAPHLVGNAAQILADRWPAQRRRHSSVDAQGRARHRLGGMAGRRGRPEHRPAPALLSAAARRQASSQRQRVRLAQTCRHAMISVGCPTGLGSGRRQGCRSNPRHRAIRRGLPSFTARRFIAAGAKPNSSSMLAERNTLVHRLRFGRKTIGFAVSRMAADEAEILSIAIDAGLSRPGPLARPVVDASWPSGRPRGAHGYFSRSKKIISRRGGCTNGPDLPSSDAANVIIGRRRGTIECASDAPRLVVRCARWQKMRKVTRWQYPRLKAKLDDRIEILIRARSRPGSNRAVPPPACG